MAAGYLILTPPQYEAEGQFKVVGSSALLSQLIEPLNTPVFRDEVLRRMGWREDGRASLYRSSLRAVVRGDLLYLRARAINADDARIVVQKTIERLDELDRERAEPKRAEAERELANVMAEIEDTKGFLGKLDYIGARVSSADFRSVLTLLGLQRAERSRLRVLETQAAAAREHVKAAQPVSVALAAPIIVSEMSVSPHAGQTLLLAAISGIVLGAAVVILKRSGDTGIGAVRA